MAHIRINKLLRYGNELSVEVIGDLLGQQVSSNDKLVLSKNHSDMSTEELIEMKNNIHRILNERLSALRSEYMDLDDKIHNPDLYILNTNEELFF
jgi:hypothetical protein